MVQEYFFPKEEAAANERQRKWAKSVNARSRHSRQNSAASNPGTSSDTETGSTQPGSTGPAPPSSVFAMAASAAPRNSLQLEEASPVTSPDGMVLAMMPAKTDQSAISFLLLNIIRVWLELKERKRLLNTCHSHLCH